MATPVELPKLGNTVDECLVSKWIRQKGDVVATGDIVVEIETDKANFEVTAPVDGTVLETFFEEGSLVPVFTNLFVIGEDGESAVEFRPQSAGLAPSDGPDTQTGAPSSEPPAASTLSVSTAAVTPADHMAPLSPRARRFAQEHDFHPSNVAGSGPGGRVLEEDLRRAYSATAVTQASSPSAVAQASRRASTVSSPPKNQARRGVRDAIARRMRESLASTAQYTMHTSADAGGLLTLRARIKASTTLPDITIGDLVTFCTIRALVDVPALNQELVDGELVEHAEIHIGFACDTPRGLLVPVVRNAHTLPISRLALQMKTLTAQALEGTIRPDDLSGGTFTISNLGSLGIEWFTPLINPPQVAILGVDAIQLKPVRREGRVALIDVIGLSLTCDHQVIDGAPGARFLQVLRDKVESVEKVGRDLGI
ncbi:MAG: 2-oxo acid dehydrogenase subunit E2 [Luteitalea sp.]|nr:2-oxo acid dehydrogenase subunit E2 [Luteitalea sp.]